MIEFVDAGWAYWFQLVQIIKYGSIFVLIFFTVIGGWIYIDLKDLGRPTWWLFVIGIVLLLLIIFLPSPAIMIQDYLTKFYALHPNLDTEMLENIKNYLYSLI